MGCLDGLNVLELGGKGPVPFAGMVLADMGAKVIACVRPEGDNGLAGVDVLARGKRRIHVDLKSRMAANALYTALDGFDVLLEGFRPGVAERLGFDPEDLGRDHPRLIVGRMSGYGQGNSYSLRAGHDINFVATGTALAHLGREGEPPPVPLNLLGDFAGGGMLLALGVLAAVVERGGSGRGQTVDAAMTDGVTYLMSSIFGMRAAGLWTAERGANLLDGGAPFYNTYETADRRFVSVGALEAKQYRQLLEITGLAVEWAQDPYDHAHWETAKLALTQAFRTRTLAEWDLAFAGSDACYAPLISIDQAPAHPYHRERGSFVEHDGLRAPAPAPRFSRTPSAVISAEHAPDAREILTELDIAPGMIDDLIGQGLVA